MWRPPEESEEPKVLEELHDREKNIRKTGEPSIDTFVEQGALEVMAAKEIASSYTAEKPIVEEDKDGVFTLKQDAIDISLDQGGDAEFKKLADEVIGTREMPDDSGSVIQDLFSFSDVELPLELTKEERETPRVSKGGNGERLDRDIVRKCFTREGLNLGRLFSYLEKHDISPLKCLMKLSREVDAVYLAVLTYSNGSFTPETEIGFDNVSPRTFVYRANEELIQYVAEEKMFVYANYKEIDKESLKPRLSDNDKRNLRSYLFMPAVYQNDTALVFMGFKKAKTSLKTIIESLISVNILS